MFENTAKRLLCVTNLFSSLLLCRAKRNCANFFKVEFKTDEIEHQFAGRRKAGELAPKLGSPNGLPVKLMSDRFIQASEKELEAEENKTEIMPVISPGRDECKRRRGSVIET